MSKKITDVFMHTTTDFTECTDGEKALYVNYLVRSGNLTKDILRNCLRELDIRGRSRILNYLPSVQSWIGIGNSLTSEQEKAIKKFCSVVSPELLIKHIVQKEADSLTHILNSDKRYDPQSVKKVFPKFKVNIEIDHNIIEMD